MKKEFKDIRKIGFSCVPCVKFSVLIRTYKADVIYFMSAFLFQNRELIPKNIPFYDFIDFADNEGVLDWEISNKIYNNFKKFKGKANDFYSGFSLTRYLEWLNVFELAKDNGVVVFS